MDPGKAGFPAYALVEKTDQIDDDGCAPNGRSKMPGRINLRVRGGLEGRQHLEIPETGGIPRENADPVAGIDEGRGEVTADETAAAGKNNERGLAHGDILAPIAVSGRSVSRTEREFAQVRQIIEVPKISSPGSADREGGLGRET
jgi:hypothetical protein